MSSQSSKSSAAAGSSTTNTTNTTASSSNPKATIPKVPSAMDEGKTVAPTKKKPKFQKIKNYMKELQEKYPSPVPGPHGTTVVGSAILKPGARTVHPMKQQVKPGASFFETNFHFSPNDVYAPLFQAKPGVIANQEPEFLDDEKESKDVDSAVDSDEEAIQEKWKESTAKSRK